jgi:hypothetical protein
MSDLTPEEMTLYEDFTGQIVAVLADSDATPEERALACRIAARIWRIYEAAGTGAALRWLTRLLDDDDRPPATLVLLRGDAVEREEPER